MHAVYLFYVKTDNIDENIRVFEDWCGSKCDENNWMMPLCAINSKGESRILAEDNDWRSRDETARELLTETYPVKTKKTAEQIASEIQSTATIEDFKVLAWLIVASDVKEFTPKKYPQRKFFENKNIINLYPDIKEQFLENMRVVIADLYSNVPQFGPKPVDVFLASYMRSTLTFIYENIFNSLNPPFIDRGTPYKYRCFDLTGYIDDVSPDGESILAVDIHT